MDPSPVYPTPRLFVTEGRFAAGEPLPLRVEVHNPMAEPLLGATAELTLEVERGVLISWNLELADVPSEATLSDATRAVTPEWSLPLNVGEGRGRFRLALSGADGAFLNEERLEVPIGG